MTVIALPVAMIEPSFGTLLVPAIGAAPLTAAGLLAAVEAAVALSAITVGTNEEYGVARAAQANPLPENHFAMHRHACSQAGLDKGDGFVAS